MSKYELIPPSDWVYDLFTSNIIVPWYETYDGIQEACVDPLEKKKHNNSDFSEKKLFYLYPTLASESINLISTNLSGYLEIRNLLGETLYSTQYSTQEVTINISFLPIGFYFLTDNLGNSVKFIKGK